MPAKTASATSGLDALPMREPATSLEEQPTDVYKRQGRISLPAMFERFTMSGASVVVASTVAYLGTIAVAANSLSATAEAICFMPGFAFGTAATTLVGQSLGAKRPDLAQEYVLSLIHI